MGIIQHKLVFCFGITLVSSENASGLRQWQEICVTLQGLLSSHMRAGREWGWGGVGG